MGSSATPQNISSGAQATLRELTALVEGEVRLGVHDRMLYATDASIYQVEPLGIVIPASIQDALRAISFCSARGLPILPRGGGTSLAGQGVNRAVVIDFSANCRQVLTVDATSGRCSVEPGVVIDELNQHLEPTGLFFAPDPATSRHANIGGCVGNNAAGARSIRYGRTSENIASLDVCLADNARVRLGVGSALRNARVREITTDVARIVRTNAANIRARFPKTIRRNAGYNLDLILHQLETSRWLDSDDDELPDEVLTKLNLAPLLCGSEGTLAVTLGAELKLHRLPRAKGLAVLGFAGVDEAIEAVAPILQTDPSAVELLDDMVIGVARANTEYRRYVDLLPAPAGEPPEAALYVEYFSDHGQNEIEEQFARLEALAPHAAVRTYTDPASMLAAWKLRKAGEPLLHGIPGRRKPVSFVEDNAVPTERLGEFVREFRKIVDEHGTRAAFWAHASVGVLHVRPLIDLRDEKDRKRAHEIAIQVADLARSLGGVMSGEHGDGRVRSPLLTRFYGPELMTAFAQIKSVFDPRGLLNPGNIVAPGPIESITESTRTRPEGRDTLPCDVVTSFDFDDEGLLGAAEACNGAGVCRKKDGSTMCPSYMATLDERHTTRGRGNALRLAITGQVPDSSPSPWSDPDTINTLDLCLSCKACKSECPSNVDIAKLKAEYTAQRWRARGGAPLRSRLITHVRTLNRFAAISPRLANLMANSKPGRLVLNQMLGLDPRRSLPPIERSLNRQLAPRAATDLPKDAPSLVLLGDCFSMYNEPGIGLAAVRVLAALGYRARLIDAGCCGRAAISAGLLDEAITMADAACRQLTSQCDGAEAVLFLEPSCLSAIQDDWQSLKMRSSADTRRQLASRSSLVEDFIEANWDSHPIPPRFTEPSADVLFHGHCHQKALLGDESGSRLLRRIAGNRLTHLDSGCCGMAGAFGMTREHFELSMKIGERVLLPAVRQAADSTLVVASGTSCRHQIRDGAQTRALHPVELLDRLLPQIPS